MKSTAIKELTMESFSDYGAFANMIDPDALKLGAKPIEFFRDMLLLDLGGAGIAAFSVCRVEKRAPVVDVTEYHTGCAEGILPLDGDILIHVGPATPCDDVPLDRIEVFRVPKGTMACLRPGVWHHAPFAHGCAAANVLIVLPERTYANDCEVFEISSDEQIEIQGG